MMKSGVVKYEIYQLEMMMKENYLVVIFQKSTCHQ